MAEMLPSYWSPFKSSDWDAAGPPNPLASGRIKKDIVSLFKEPLPGIFIIPDEAKFCLVHCLVLGPRDTPYEGGFFHFVVRFGPSYPIEAPRVQLMTTGGGRVRFNPNLYSDGKVCLSILGTWEGPPWRPVQNLGTLLLSIQSLLNDEPIYNEPGLLERYEDQSIEYNEYLTHETIRVSICDQLEDYYSNNNSNKVLPSELVEVMKESFMNNYENYVEICNKNKKLDGRYLKDLYSRKQTFYNYRNLLERLENLKVKISSSPITETKKQTTTEVLTEKIEKMLLEMPCTNPDYEDIDFNLFDSDEDSVEVLYKNYLDEEEKTGTSIINFKRHKLLEGIKFESSIDDVENYEEAKSGTENLENDDVDSDEEDLEAEEEAYSCNEDAKSSNEDLDDSTQMTKRQLISRIWKAMEERSIKKDSGEK